jgi:PAS domain S-box-containing protein
MGKRLKEREELFRTLFEQAPVGVVMGNRERYVVTFNHMYEKITGRGKEELLRGDFASYTHPEDAPKDLANFKNF